ncbi:conserved membrane hypothetical protein [Rubrivivax sp. A210]|uniref:hypothetical protein n=1 Tax=Rubrivivax sp. A210 TaxID=2772301 RepID=UPI001918218C|nr:hypothetical protein [Rubrivivax sp. A210]CAD5374160.1 conserved membrane hypothetical protein [Rubrivivax sp. A210]
MGPIDAFWHLANLFLPALALGALAAALAKLLWRRELAAVAWRRLALPAALAGAALTLAGLLLFGRDGKMATYAAVVAGCALMLWWRGFGPGRK